MQDFLRRWTVVEPTDREEVLATTSLLPQEIDAILDEHNTEEVTRRIVHLRAQGYTAREIAGQVELSKTTVDRRLRDFATNLISTRGTNERRESQ
ncbi:MAG: helix-turn-helix domain-containing protein [Bryobacterales bacterium]|nr:helix-turn-helix domain-containing protein [Bryobacterales bacterium]